MRNPFAAVARVIVDFVTPSAEVRAKALPPLMLPHVTVPEMKRAETLAEFWTLHHHPMLKERHPNTLRQTEYAWNKWIEPALGHLRWSELKPQTIAQWIRGLMLNGYIRHDPARGKLAPQTIHNLSSRARSMVSHAVSLEYLESNPFTAANRYLPDSVPSDRNKNREQRFTLEQARLLIHSPKIAQVYRDEYAAAIYLCTRRGELHGLRWRCVLLDDATPHVKIECSYRLPTKTGVVRRVPIHPELQPILRRMRAERKPDAVDLVFPSSRGKDRMQAKTADHYNRARDLLGLPDCVYHSLRKTGGTLYRMAGLSKAEVADVLGHAKTVTDLYAPVQLAPLAARMALMSIGAADQTDANELSESFRADERGRA